MLLRVWQPAAVDDGHISGLRWRMRGADGSPQYPRLVLERVRGDCPVSDPRPADDVDGSAWRHDGYRHPYGAACQRWEPGCHWQRWWRRLVCSLADPHCNMRIAMANANLSRLSTHWRWVIMLIVLTVGIAGIWIGACIWRRRYLKRKEQDPHRRTSGNLRGTGPGGGASWGPSGSAAMPRSYGDGVVDGRSNSRRVPPSSGPLATAATGPNGHGHGRNGNAVGNGKMPMSMVQSGNQPAGAFMPGAAAKAMDGRSGSKRGSKEQRKWIVKERT